MSEKISGFKILRFASVCLLSVFVSAANSESKSIVLGGKDGWKPLSLERSVSHSRGKFGWESIVLDTNSRKETEFTDLLLDFEKNAKTDLTGNYAITESNFSLSGKSKMGKKSALSTGRAVGMTLKGKNGSLFGTQGFSGSFAIEFWLRPSIAENGEVVFSWRSSRTVGDKVNYQMITASFFNNHLEWKFSGVFDGFAENHGEAVLSSLSNIVPDEWAHHTLSFDEHTGLLEYRINGKTEALRYMTESGHERRGSIFTPILGVPAEIEICPLFTGSIDDFRIVRTSIDGGASSQALPSFKALPKPDDLSAMNYDEYQLSGGRIESQPLPVNPGSRLERVDAILDTPAETDVQIFVRGGDNYFEWTENKPEWKAVGKDGKIDGEISARYFQVAADLYPDGSGKKSPSVTEISLSYTETALPLPPFRISAQAGDGSVTLAWSHSLDDSVGGYYVYYGTRPGEYLGVGAVQGSSPVDAGNVSTFTVSGLKNGTVYYFAVATYSSIDETFVGTLSKEVSARPLPKN